MFVAGAREGELEDVFGSKILNSVMEWRKLLGSRGIRGREWWPMCICWYLEKSSV